MRVHFAFCMIMACLLVASVARAADQFPADNDFVRNAEQAANKEVADARLALKRSRHSDVRAAAQMMERDGLTANRRLSALAVEKGWPAPSLDAPEELHDYSDHSFIAHEINAQKDAIVFYKEEAMNGADTDLQTFARETLPILQHSLASLQNLRSS
jgi:predicted outer membrane protein